MRVDSSSKRIESARGPQTDTPDTRPAYQLCQPVALSVGQGGAYGWRRGPPPLALQPFAPQVSVLVTFDAVATEDYEFQGPVWIQNRVRREAQRQWTEEVALYQQKDTVRADSEYCYRAEEGASRVQPVWRVYLIYRPCPCPRPMPWPYPYLSPLPLLYGGMSDGVRAACEYLAGHGIKGRGVVGNGPGGGQRTAKGKGGTGAARRPTTHPLHGWTL